MTGPMKAPDGAEIPPTGKSFEVDSYTVTKWVCRLRRGVDAANDG